MGIFMVIPILFILAGGALMIKSICSKKQMEWFVLSMNKGISLSRLSFLDNAEKWKIKSAVLQKHGEIWEKRRFWNNKFKPPFSFSKNGFAEGLLKSPFFKDTAVSWRYRHVLFYLS